MCIKETKGIRKKKRKENKRNPRKVKKIYGLNYRHSFLKNKWSNIADSQDLSEKSLNPVMLYLAMQSNLTHLDKELKRSPFLCI